MSLTKIEGGSFERIKGLVELALHSGRQFQSKQTGFIHYFPHQKLDAVHQAIPLYENLLFSLVLLRTRVIEHVNEAKNLLTGLLHFQHADGNFPIYMHEFPHCKDNLSGILHLAPLYWVLKHFGHILGGDLKQKIENSFKNLLQYGKRFHEQTPMPHSLAIRFAGALVGGGRLLKIQQWEEQGRKALGELVDDQDSWTSTAFLADHLIGLQMADINPFIQGTWEKLGLHLMTTWDQELCAYVGPCVRELQFKFNPLPNVYDLYMGNFFGHFSKRSEEVGLYHLQAALIQPSEMVELEAPERGEGCYKDQKWVCRKELGRAYSLLERKPSQTSAENTFTPFRFIWGDPTKVHTFVCQGTKSTQVDYKLINDHIELYFDLEREIDLQDKEKQREINFYFDFSSDYKLLVDKQTATTFSLGQKLTLELANQKMSVNFELVEGSGQFIGHISLGNRPSQSLHDADLRFEAYDWNLFLRTIRREGRCRIKVTIQVESL